MRQDFHHLPIGSDPEPAQALSPSTGSSSPGAAPAPGFSPGGFWTARDPWPAIEDRWRGEPGRHEAAAVTGPGDHYRVLFDLVPHGCLATDLAGTIQEANSAAAALLRVPQEELAGKRFAAFVSADHRRRVGARLASLRNRQNGVALASARRLPSTTASPVEEWHVRMDPPGGDPFEASVTIRMVQTPPRSGDRRAASEFELLWALHDISRRRRMEKRLKRSEQRFASLYRRMLSHRDRLRVLSARYLHAREEEARRIAHQLHDEAGQIIAAGSLALEKMAEQLRPDADRWLHEVNELFEQIEERLRQISHELRPTALDDLGLLPALRLLGEGFSARMGIPVLVTGDTEGRLDPAVETAAYRIVQEAVVNIGRHARAGHAFIDVLRDAESLAVTVRDDGIGFDGGLAAGDSAIAGQGLGLLGIRERLDALGGRMQIRSAPGKGTQLRIAVPLRRWPWPARSCSPTITS